jgi:hypothetical protein
MYVEHCQYSTSMLSTWQALVKFHREQDTLGIGIRMGMCQAGPTDFHGFADGHEWRDHPRKVTGAHLYSFEMTDQLHLQAALTAPSSWEPLALCLLPWELYIECLTHGF